MRSARQSIGRVNGSHLSIDRSDQLNLLHLPGVDGQDLVVALLVELHCLHIVKQAFQMGLEIPGMRQEIFEKRGR